MWAWSRARAKRLLAQIDVSRDHDRVGIDQRWYWAAPLLIDATLGGDASRAFRDIPWLGWEWSGSGEGVDAADHTGAALWERHVAEAQAVFEDGIALGRRPRDLAAVVALIGLAGPGNVAFRSFGRTVPGADADEQLLKAAQLGWGIRRLFNTPEAIAIVDALYPNLAYWQASLNYALNGNLQAVFDEWAHVMAEDAGAGRGADDAALERTAKRMSSALSVGTGRVEVDTLDDRPHEAWRTHFGVRYGQANDSGGRDSAHPQAVRRAFNSPFWPFVLATTSVGQEGLDFHTYCHAVVHWNLPPTRSTSNNVKDGSTGTRATPCGANVAEHHAGAAIRSAELDPWMAAFDAAVLARPASEDDLVPYWLQHGSAVIERYVPALPLSRDAERFERVRHLVTLYRLAFGQPRQDDLLAYLQQTLGQADAEDLAEVLKIDLAPPRRDDVAQGRRPASAGGS